MGSAESVADLEHFLRNEKLLGANDDSSEQAQACLDMIQKWRESQHATHSTRLSQDTFAVSHSETLHVENAIVPPLPGYERELFLDVGNPTIVPKPPDFETPNGDWPYLDGLHNTCNVTDQWLFEAFPSDLSGDLLSSFNTAAEGNMFIPGNWTQYPECHEFFGLRRASRINFFVASGSLFRLKGAHRSHLHFDFLLPMSNCY